MGDSTHAAGHNARFESQNLAPTLQRLHLLTASMPHNAKLLVAF